MTPNTSRCVFSCVRQPSRDRAEFPDQGCISLVWLFNYASLYFVHKGSVSRREQFGSPKKIKSKQLLKGPWQLNTGPFGWKTRLSLKPEETFHVKLFTLFHQNRPTF